MTRTKSLGRLLSLSRRPSLAPQLATKYTCIFAPFMLCSLILTMTATIHITSVEANQIKTETASEQDFEELGLHYGKYLKEVVAALDKDQKFTETIKNMDSNDIKSGKVAEQLKHVHADIRKKLNDIKYMEVQRLRDAATRKNEMEQYGETYHGKDKRKWRTLGASLEHLPEHMGSHGTYFDVDDLHKLMVVATNDLEKLDKERKEDYKTYEMEKEWQFQERLKLMNETEKQEAIKLRQQLKEKHNDHVKVHEPGTKQQFEEVWEKSDKLPKAEFDPKTFFSLHDTNSDNHWDQSEVRQLLVTEISKIYDPNNPEDDPNEMEENYERMREHVYKQIDTDRDGLISKKEFLEYSQKPEFNKDNGWDDVSKKDAYTKQDYEDFTKNRDKMLHGMHGHYDPTYYANQPANLHLPDWGLGMPAGAHPSQYYGYHVDPNHPQAQQILAQQQLAYQQQAAAAAAYHQNAYQQGAYMQGAHQQGVPHQGVQQQGAYAQAPQVAPPQQVVQQQGAYHQAPQVVPQQQAPQVVPQQQGVQQQGSYQQAPQVVSQQQGGYQQGAQQQGAQQQGAYQQAPQAAPQQQGSYQQGAQHQGAYQQAPQGIPQQTYQHPPAGNMAAPQAGGSGPVVGNKVDPQQRQSK